MMRMTKKEKLENLNACRENTLLHTLNIKFTELGDDFLVATMPITSSVYQPMGFLHGGANAALAETLGSSLSSVLVADEGKSVVGTNINCNHLKTKCDGTVIGKAKIVKKGNKQHISEIEIRDEYGNLICYSTMTNYVIDLCVE